MFWLQFYVPIVVISAAVGMRARLRNGFGIVPTMIICGATTFLVASTISKSSHRSDGLLPVCSLASDVTELHLVPDTGASYHVIEAPPFFHAHGRELASSTTSSNNKNNNDTTVTIPYDARKCDCPLTLTKSLASPPDPTIFCPLSAHACGIWRRPGHDDVITCFSPAHGRELCRNLLWSALACLLTLLVWLCLSKAGRHLADLVIAHCCCQPDWNLIVVRRIQSNDPQRAMRMMRRNIRIRSHWQQDAEWHMEAHALRMFIMDGPTSEQFLRERYKATSLTLPTKIYHREDETDAKDNNDAEGGALDTSHNSHSHSHSMGMDDENDMEDECMICFLPLEDGDRIGDLTCGHKFHVECLKEWCRRKNRCPLCQQENIATPDDPLSSRGLVVSEGTIATRWSGGLGSERSA